MQKYITQIQDCFYIEPIIHYDNRGLFSEIYKDFNFECKQINYSYSKKGVIRGIHRTPYAKFVTCVSGKVYDVCVDLRENSETYNKYFGLILDSSILNSIYIPPYCGHSFLALEDSMLVYLQSDTYNKNYDQVFCYKEFDIEWPKIEQEYILSNKDFNACNKAVL